MSVIRQYMIATKKRPRRAVARVCSSVSGMTCAGERLPRPTVGRSWGYGKRVRSTQHTEERQVRVGDRYRGSREKLRISKVRERWGMGPHRPGRAWVSFAQTAALKAARTNRRGSPRSTERSGSEAQRSPAWPRGRRSWAKRNAFSPFPCQSRRGHRRCRAGASPEKSNGLVTSWPRSFLVEGFEDRDGAGPNLPDLPPPRAKGLQVDVEAPHLGEERPGYPARSSRTAFWVACTRSSAADDNI